MKKIILILLLISFSTGVTRAEELKLTLSTEPASLDWNLATENVAYQILNQLMEGLTQYDADLKPIPAVAQSWDVSEDGKAYVFHLNPNYKWSDGKPISAEDFKFSWLRLLDPKTAAEYAYFLFDIEGAQDFNSGKITNPDDVGIRVVDNLTLEIRLAKPAVYFPSITTFMVTFPMRKDIVEKYGDQWTRPENIVTLGPYRLEHWHHNYKLILISNPHYGGNPQPVVNEITIFLVNDPTTSLALYERGDIDIAIPHPMAIAFYKNNPDLISIPQLRGSYFGFNVTKKPFDDPRIRQALSLSLDKTILPKLLQNSGEISNSWIPPGIPAANKNIGLFFNPQKARELLKEAGFDFNQTLQLAYNSDPTNKKMGEWAQNQWKKNLGITVELMNQEWKTYLSELNNDPPGMFRLGWGADYPDPDNFMNLFTSYSGNNHSRWKNETYDRLIHDAAVEPDIIKRTEIYNQAQKLLIEEDAVIIPLFVSVKNILVKQKFHPYPITGLDFVYYKKLGNL